MMLILTHFRMMKPYIWLQTSDGSINQVEQEIAMFSPIICREIIEKGMGSSKICPVCLPEKVTPETLSLILDYCRFHHVPGRSNKVLLSLFKRFSIVIFFIQYNLFKAEKQ